MGNTSPERVLNIKKALAIVSHFKKPGGNEHYLVRWEAPKGTAPRDWPYSWHSVHEFSGGDDKNNNRACLELLQKYVDAVRAIKVQNLTPQTGVRRKRNIMEEDSNDVPSRSPTPLDSLGRLTYNCSLNIRKNGKIRINHEPQRDVDASGLPNAAMRQRANTTKTEEADGYIRREFKNIMRDFVSGCVADQAKNPIEFRGHPGLTVVNHVDDSSPPMDYKWSASYTIRDGVVQQDPEASTGCQTCRPDMGQHVGCEYTRICDCQEYSRIDENRMTPAQRKRFDAKDFTNQPKWFPYGTYDHLLVKAYLDHRFPVYECNDHCRCGPRCKTRVVQHSRQISLEVFKTDNGRGWGLRCPQDLARGQFIDYYFGEVITNQEADVREQSGKGKESYLFSLDKFDEELDETQRENMYVVDGQFIGGPTRFINHSCDPNCRQYVVSFNKNDHFLYNLAIFAVKPIKAGTELTFDYLDSEDTEESASQQDSQGVKEDSILCLCGARNCRKWLWK